VPVATSAACLAEVWRGGARQARLSQIAKGLRVVPLDRSAGYAVGELLAVSGTSGVVDAHVALVANPEGLVLTSEPGDIAHLVGALGSKVVVEAI
jgi:hypothetical protein